MSRVRSFLLAGEAVSVGEKDSRRGHGERLTALGMWYRLLIEVLVDKQTSQERQGNLCVPIVAVLLQSGVRGRRERG